MANEYLLRTPTSTGNRRTFTWAGWVKRLNPGQRDWIFNTRNQAGTGDFFAFDFLASSDNDILRVNDSANSDDTNLKSTHSRRDPSWMHLVLSVDTTKGVESDRVNIYVNGVQVSNYTVGNYPTQNALMMVNSLNGMNIGTAIDGSGNPIHSFDGEMFDVFFIDGQALAPDVFGFYKEGKGYQSSGSTQATDFRPGQWSPHSPRKIKTEIERKGGFGVNGFYLPMNDSSNVGADFHMTPNSIIKLKGEDLPQPRNGLPTTSDDYVSQLRQEVGTLGFDGVVDFRSSNRNTLQDSGDAINIGTNDFTVEAFVYHTDIPQNSLQYIFMSTAQSNTNTFAFAVESDRIIAGIYAGTWSNATKVEGALPVGSLKTGQWYHYAACRSGTTLRLFINGKMIVEDTSHTENYDNTSQYGCRVGCDNNFGASEGGAKAIKGFLSNVRVVNGTALYTSNFTPPTSALTAVTNTVLLCCQSTTDPTEAAVSPGTLSVLTDGGGLTATRNELSGSIVFAVPGVNTQPTGSELVTNGTFDTDVSGWIITDTGTLVRQSDGTVEVTRGTSARVAYQDITTVVGTTYELSVDITAIAGSHGQIYVYTTDHGGNIDTNIGYSFYTGTYKGTFTADATTTRISLYAHPSGSTSYDNVSVKETTIRDYSADIKGSGTNKTSTVNGAAGIRNNDTSGSAVNGYYGSALTFGGSSNYFDAGSSSDFDFGSGDFTIEYWQNVNGFASTPGLGIWDNVNNQRSWLIYQNSSGLPRFYTSVDGTSSVSINATGTIPTNQWNHFCMERNGSNLVGYVNGVCVGVNPNLGTQSLFTPADPFLIGKWDTSYYIDGEIQDLRVYKGVAKYKGGFDVSKPFEPVGIESWRQVPDTCKNNFCMMNPLNSYTVKRNTGAYVASIVNFTEGNLNVRNSGSAGLAPQMTAFSSFGMDSGKWYWELSNWDNPSNERFGISLGVEQVFTQTGNGAAIECMLQVSGSNGQISSGGNHNGTDYEYLVSGTIDNTNATALTSSSDVVGLAFDRDNMAFYVYTNGTLTASITNITTSKTKVSTWFATKANTSSSSSSGQTYNFGQNPTFGGTLPAGTYTDSNGKGLFKYQPPAGYLALCDDNLSTPAIADPGEYFKTVLWTGDGSVGKNITGVGFQPDLVWIKSRSFSNNHHLFDVVRGPNNILRSSTTDAESNPGNVMPSFNSDGFTVGEDGGNNATNDSGSNFVAWCWKAGGAAVPNTDGTITSQVSANQTAGFSIVSYTGTGSAGTVGHGLGKRPKVVIVKDRNGNTNWPMFVDGISNNTNDLLQLNLTNATATAGNFFNGGDTTTTTFPLGTGDGQTNASGNDHIAYCWAEIPGYSKFSFYQGTGQAEGPFVYCGFKPAWVMVKNADDTGGRNWGIQDSSRRPTNPCNKQLKADSSEVENSGLADTTFQIDMLSNGFKIRNNTGIWNNSGDTIFFMAFAESPFQTANAK